MKIYQSMIEFGRPRGASIYPASPIIAFPDIVPVPSFKTRHFLFSKLLLAISPAVLFP